MIGVGLRYIACLLFLSFFVVACADAGNALENSSSHQAKRTMKAGVVANNVYSDLFLDSMAVERFISSHGIGKEKAAYLRDFYQSRQYQYAWFSKAGLDEHGRAFWNLHNNYLNYSQDSSLFDKQLHGQMEALVNDEAEASLEADKLREIELLLSDHFFDYAKYAFTGSVDPKKLKWHIPRKKINAVALLDSLVATNGKNLHEWEPVNPQYKQMRTALMRYYSIEKQGGWQEIKGDKKVYRLDDSSATVRQIKERLRLSGDYTAQDSSLYFTNDLEIAVQAAQKRFGLAQDGAVGPATLRALNKPVSHRIEQMLVNMERMRWMPAQVAGKRLVVNIPEFKLHVYEGDKEVFDMRIVVGKAAHKTVVFNDKLKYIVFSPYWNVPASIVRNEILPAMQQNPSYLKTNNMEQTGTRNGLPVIRQKPGGNNSLGQVKFLFPNSYAIYFHDTPAKHLFDENKRAFSHGCIRLAEPKRLAAYLLQDKEGWNESRISSAMHAGSEKWVTLSEPVSVAITYFTAWVGEEGQVNFRNDIYRHDERLAEMLFE